MYVVRGVLCVLLEPAGAYAPRPWWAAMYWPGVNLYEGSEGQDSSVKPWFSSSILGFAVLSIN